MLLLMLLLCYGDSRGDSFSDPSQYYCITDACCFDIVKLIDGYEHV